MFTVPDSSSPPSTPDTRSRKQSSNLFAASHISTTPSGPPPTSFTAASTTPAGPPPSSVFGSTYTSAIPYGSAAGFGRNDPRSSPSRPRQPPKTNARYDAMDEDHDMDSLLESVDQPIPSIEGQNIGAVAKALAIKPAALTESDEFVLGTEHIIGNLCSYINGRQASADEIDAALSTATDELLKTWASETDPTRQVIGIGPGNNASPLTKAMFLASFLLSFHHPAIKTPPPGSFRSLRYDSQPKPIPEVLLDWLRDHHNQYPNEFEDMLNADPNPTAQERFWDVILALVVRGAVSDASRLLKEADFRDAVTALEDGQEKPGYRGKQLGNIQRVVNRATAVLDSCPGVQSGDWNVKGHDWTIFRQRVNQALSDLETFAEGSNADRGFGDDRAFEAENFGLDSVRSDDFSISTMSRRAESRVPWAIYQNLTVLYAHLLGTRREIVASSQDWVEATIALTVWWDGEQDDEAAKANLTSSRRSMTRSQGPRAVDMLPRTAYQQKLAASIRQITSENEDAELQIKTTNPIEVGLACIFEGDLEGVITILRGWSATISSAVVEIANLGSWLGAALAPSQALMDGFDQSDLLVLSFAQPSQKGINRDEILLAYAERLYERAELKSPRLHEESEGWELAIQVLGRLGSTNVADRRIGKFLDQLDLTVGDRIEKVMSLCNRLNLPEVGRRMAEKYANHLADATRNYGGALYYYARAHNIPRIKDVVNVLTSSCIVSSLSYPSTAELDTTLNSIINAPKQTLAKLASLDREAAELLSAHISGYAMVRRFYDMRDQEITASAAGRKAALRPVARKKEAAAALVAVVTSASDSIHGGLYDDEVDSVVQVDVLLVLLGEALMFLNQPKRSLTSSQILVLMKAAEDLSSAPSSVQGECAECLKSALADAHGLGALPSPRAQLAASTTSLSATNSQFSFINRSDITGLSGSGGLTGGAKERAWDWRVGLGSGAGLEEVLRILRLGLARELSRCWVEGEV